MDWKAWLKEMLLDFGPGLIVLVLLIALVWYWCGCATQTEPTSEPTPVVQYGQDPETGELVAFDKEPLAFFGFKEFEDCCNCPEYNVILLPYQQTDSDTTVQVPPYHQHIRAVNPRTEAGVWRLGWQDHDTGQWTICITTVEVSPTDDPGALWYRIYGLRGYDKIGVWME